MKKTFKKLVVTLSVCAMAFGLVACGDKESDTTETTTEATTEVTTTEKATLDDATEEDATPDDAIDIDLDENGVLTMSGVKITIPDGFEYSADDSAEDSATFIDYNNSSALVIGIDGNNTYYDDSNVVDVFDEQIKVPYGENITHSPALYNGHEATEWVLDNEDNGYVGRSLVICDGSILIYIEYISYSGSLDSYTQAVSTIDF